MRAWIILQWRNAHQPYDVEAVGLPAKMQEIIHAFRHDSSFLRLAARVHLHQAAQRAALLLAFLGNCFGNLRPVDGLDHIKQRHCFCSFVALQGPDQVQFEIRVFGPQARPFGLGFLHPVFTKDTLPGGDHRLDFHRRKCL